MGRPPLRCGVLREPLLCVKGCIPKGRRHRRHETGVSARMIINIALGVLGIAILIYVLLDFLYTAIGAAPVAPLSNKVAWATWWVFTRVMPKGKARHRLSGPIVMTAVALAWIVLVSFGWTLVFQFTEMSVVMSDSERPAGFTRDFAFVGHLLSTLGGGPFKTESPVWLVLSVLAGVNGMVILTLSVSFVLSTTTTVAQGRGMLTKAPMFDADSDEMSNVMLPALADLVANLNSMQFTLYYSAEDPAHRLPGGLVELARRVAPYPEQMRRLRIALSPLPGFRAPEGRSFDQLNDAAFIAQLDAWAERYTL